MFCSFDETLSTRDMWDPSTQSPLPADVEEDFISFFGIKYAIPLIHAWDNHRNHIFKKSEFVPLAMALQEKAAAGKGAVVTMEHTTVDNTWWNIKAGTTVTVTWVYSARVLDFEKALPAEVQKHLHPNQDDASLTVGYWSKFHGFPTYPTSEIHLSRYQTNIVAEM